MKKALYLYPLALLLSSFTGNEPSAKKLDCASVKNGKFKIEDRERGVTTIIERIGNTQIETVEEYGQKFLLDVAWTDECTYTLQLRKLLQNDIEQDFPDSVIVTARIMELTDSSYIIETTTSATTYAIKFELVRMRN